MIHRLNETAKIEVADPQAFAKNFDRLPFAFQHNLATNELFRLERVARLANQLPEDLVEYDEGDGLAIGEVFKRIQSVGSSILLKNVESSPAYAKLLDECLWQIDESSPHVSKTMALEQAYILISSPHEETPFNFEQENCIVFQVRGSQAIRVFDRNDRNVLSEERIEEHVAVVPRDFGRQEIFWQRGELFELKSNEALYQPAFAPRLTEFGSEISISFIIKFATEESENRKTLHLVNHELRKLGWTPSGVSNSDLRDKVKLGVFQVVCSLKRLIAKVSRCFARVE